MVECQHLWERIWKEIEESETHHCFVKSYYLKKKAALINALFLEILKKIFNPYLKIIKWNYLKYIKLFYYIENTRYLYFICFN